MTALSLVATPVAMSANPLLTLADVAKSYGEGEAKFRALESIDLTIEAGGFCALTGPSGSGKSTLLRILGLLDVPSRGQIAFSGKPLTAGDEAARLALRREHFGFVLQNYNLVPVLSALENVELALFHQNSSARSRRKTAARMLELVGLSDRLYHRPQQMSGWQQQRVAVARALVHEPKLVLADEPTANLDLENGLRLMRLLHDLRSQTGATFIVSTHDSRMLPYFSTIIRLDDGIISL